MVHHLLFNYLNPMLEPLFIHDSYSCRVGKGTLEGIRRCTHHIRSCSQNWSRPAYALQLDIQGYFMSINKARLYEILWHDIRTRANVLHPVMQLPWRECVDYEFLDFLIRSILMRDPVKDCLIIGDLSEWDGFPPSKSLRLSRIPGVGLPIGDLTSQLFSNVYLNPLDQFVKRKLRCRHYGRYVDDAYVIDTDPAYLEALVPSIGHFLLERLGLRLHPAKIRITPVDHGIRFLGAVIKPYRTYVSNRTVRSFHSKMFKWEQRCLRRPLNGKEVDTLVQIVNSYTGYFSHFKCFRILQAQFACSPLRRYILFSGGFRKAELRICYRIIIPFTKDPLLFGEWKYNKSLTIPQ